jgi:hypothetical protein
MPSAGPDHDNPGAAALDERPAPPRDDSDEHEITAALGGTVAAEPAPGTSHGKSPTARELLAQVASRLPHAPRAAELEHRERRFVRWLLLFTALFMTVLFGTLWWLDPISVTGRQTRFSIVENGGVRQAKLDLMQELKSPPDVLVLGSSRSMKLDPADIERVSGATAFNGAVSGGTTKDMFLYASYAEELWGGEGEYPHLVLGVVHDVFRDEGTAALDPRLKKFLPRAAQDHPPLEVAKQLLTVKTVEAGWRASREVVPRDGWSSLLHPTEGVGRHDAALATTGKQKGNQRENLSARGMQQFDPSVDYKRPLDKRVETQMRSFVERSFQADADYTGVDEGGLDYLVKMIRIANSHGDVPTLWVTPFNPEAIQYLPAEEYERRDTKFRDTIRELQRDKALRFEFVDLADLDTFGGDPDEFYDGIHMTPKNTELVIEHLDAEGLLAPKPG